ncbi:MAG: ATP-binding protein [Candidatus Binataceae bacterium]
MGLRAKLTIGFLVPLAVTTLAIAGLETGHTTQSMVNQLASLGNLLVHQTFEEMRSNQPPSLQALRDNRGFRNFLNSMLAFGEAVVAVRVEDTNGITVVAEPQTLENQRVADVPSIGQLQAEDGWRETLSMLLNLGPGSIYKVSGVVQIDGQYAGTIKIELSTALIAARVRRSIMTGLYLIGVALVLGSVAGTIMVGTVLRSVTMLTASVEQLTTARSSPAIRVESHDELGKLADKFNLLSRRIMADRHQWEQERDRLVSAVSSINDAVIMLDSAGRVRFANSEALGRLGMPDGLAAGKHLAQLLGPGHSLVRLAGTALSAHSELHNVHMELDGPGSAKFLVSLLEMDLDDGTRGGLLVLRDVSLVEELEETLNFSRIMARQGRMLSGLGHQLRNPLYALGLQVALLADDARNGAPLEERIEAMRTELGRITQMIGSLLRFIRLERLDLSEFMLNDLMREVAARHVTLPKHRVEYQLNENVTDIEGDRALLFEALANIVANAIDAMPEGGRIRISSRLAGGEGAEIIVNDEGSGIDQENLSSIFDFCFTTKPAGAGIGLSMALRIIDLHRGTLKIGSQPSRGTTVRITLPLRQAVRTFTPPAPGVHAGEFHA